MATHILVEDILDEMMSQISYIKLNTYLNLRKQKWKRFLFVDFWV